MELPSGTVTFLFSDIEGSTRLLQRLRSTFVEVLSAHQELLRAAWTAYGGFEVSTEGDSFFVVFPRATDAVFAAIQAQRALANYNWPQASEVRVRMGLHTGTPILLANNYAGLDVHRAARIASAGHGGQVLLSYATRELIHHELPEDVGLRDLGEHRLKDLQRTEHLYQLLLPDLPTEFPPLKTLDRHRHNLPIQPTQLVGRDGVVRAVGELLKQVGVKLVTLTGPGGIGKSRLALQTAAELVDLFSDGVYFVSLDSISDPQLVPSAIARTLELRESQGQSLAESLADFLVDKNMLLILDNFEQVVPAAPFVARLQASCAGLKMLATSRIPLHLRGEKEYPIPPLAVPEVIGQAGVTSVDAFTRYPAVALFIERARDVKPDFQVTEDNAAIIAGICEQLDGLPLAIELAATRIKLLPPRTLLARLSNRLQLLTAGALDLPERQRTLRSTIAWSYELLSAVEKAFIQRFSVFVNGCTFEAAERVCIAPDGLDPLNADVLDLLGSLVDKSLIQQQDFQTVDTASSHNTQEPRFRMLEIIRDYGLEQLEASGEAEATRKAHATYYLDLAERAYRHLFMAEQSVWLRELEQEHRNLLVVLNWAQSHMETTIKARLAGSLWPFWLMQGYFSEGHQWLDEFVAQGTTPVKEPGDHDVPPIAWQKILRGVGALALWQGNQAKAVACLEESAALARKEGNSIEVIDTLKDLGLAFQQLGNLDRATELYEECLAVAQQIGNPLYIASILNNLGVLVQAQGDLDRAAAIYGEALALSQQVGSQQGIAVILINLAVIARLQGKLDRALSLLKDSLKLVRGLGSPLLTVSCLEMFADLAGVMGESERMARLLGAASAARESLDAPVLSLDANETEQLAAVAKKAIGETAWDAAFSAGRTTALDVIVKETLE